MAREVVLFGFVAFPRSQLSRLLSVRRVSVVKRPVHPAALDEDALLAQCDLSKNRSSGPGGQHRNKVESQVILRHRPTGIEAQAAERRSSHENKRVALRRLRLLLAVEVRTPTPAGEIGSALWRSRVKRPPTPRVEEIAPGIRVRAAEATGGRIECSPDHHDYPALLAEALDAIADAGWDVKKAALRLGVSPSQLVKFVKEHPPALIKVNEYRHKMGEHPLK